MCGLFPNVSTMTAEIISLNEHRKRKQHLNPDTTIVHYRGERFRYVDLLMHTPDRYVFAALEKGVKTPQAWWDDIAAEWPLLAERTAAKCRKASSGAASR